MNNSRETQDFANWLVEKLLKHTLGLDVPRVVEADPVQPDQLPNDTKMIQGAIVDMLEGIKER